MADKKRNFFLSRNQTKDVSWDLQAPCKHSDNKQDALTEIQELLHGQRRGGELGEMVDVFGHVGQRCSLHQRPNKVHFTGHLEKPADQTKRQ